MGAIPSGEWQDSVQSSMEGRKRDTSAPSDSSKNNALFSPQRLPIESLSQIIIMMGRLMVCTTVLALAVAMTAKASDLQITTL